jgi:hypothetical protein
VLIGLGHHRICEHGEDRPGGESEDESDGVGERVLEQAVAGQRGKSRDERDPDPEPEDSRPRPAARDKAGRRGDRLRQIGDEDGGEVGGPPDRTKSLIPLIAIASPAKQT